MPQYKYFKIIDNQLIILNLLLNKPELITPELLEYLLGFYRYDIRSKFLELLIGKLELITPELIQFLLNNRYSYVKIRAIKLIIDKSQRITYDQTRLLLSDYDKKVIEAATYLATTRTDLIV